MIKYAVIVLALLTMFTSIGSAQETTPRPVRWVMLMSGNAILGTNNENAGDDAAVEAGIGYFFSKQMMVGLNMTQMTQDEQIYRAFIRAYTDKEEGRAVTFFGQAELGELSNLGNTSFAIALNLGAEWQLSDLIGLQGKITNVSDFGNGDLTADQLVGLGPIIYFR